MAQGSVSAQGPIRCYCRRLAAVLKPPRIACRVPSGEARQWFCGRGEPQLYAIDLPVDAVAPAD